MQIGEIKLVHCLTEIDQHGISSNSLQGRPDLFRFRPLFFENWIKPRRVFDRRISPGSHRLPGGVRSLFISSPVLAGETCLTLVLVRLIDCFSPQAGTWQRGGGTNSRSSRHKLHQVGTNIQVTLLFSICVSVCRLGGGIFNSCWFNPVSGGWGVAVALGFDLGNCRCTAVTLASAVANRPNKNADWNGVTADRPQIIPVRCVNSDTASSSEVALGFWIFTGIPHKGLSQRYPQVPLVLAVPLCVCSLILVL